MDEMMNAKVRIQNVYDEILEETNQELVVVKDRKTFIGALFFKKEKWNKPRKIVEEVIVEGSALDVMLAAYNLMKKYNMTKKDDKTFKTMVHWQYINGFSDECITDGYKFKNDTEYLASLV